ncbi:MAG TPA: methyltransferase domain-containing protein, partial [Actinomycetota bacterium]|nr:methyltransferase domain-containing protein [Actinomycetota bacterium]
ALRHPAQSTNDAHAAHPAPVVRFAADLASSTRTPELSVVVPVWRGEHDLRRLVPSLLQALRALGVPWEVVVSAGPRSERDAARAAGTEATFVASRGTGYGDILRAGLARATGRHVLTMDADFGHRPEFVRTMWEHRGAGEVLIASRYVPGAVAEMGAVRRVASRSVNVVHRKLLSLPYRDLTSGFRLYRRDVLREIGPLRSRGLDVLPEALVKAYCEGWRIAEIPFRYRGARPWTRARMVRMGLGYVGTLGRLFALRNSVKAADYDHRAFDSWIPLQRYWQRRRFRIIRDFAAGAGRTLDIGCGSSRIVQALGDGVGVDLAVRKLRWLRRPGRLLAQADINRLPFRGGSFDAVICSEVIEHVPREALDLRDMVRVLRPGGVLILGTPDYGRRRWRALEWVYGRVFPGGYAREHVNRYTHERLRRELRELGLAVLECRYVGGSEMIFKAQLPAEPPARVPELTASAG